MHVRIPDGHDLRVPGRGPSPVLVLIRGLHRPDGQPLLRADHSCVHGEARDGGRAAAAARGDGHGCGDVRAEQPGGDRGGDACDAVDLLLRARARAGAFV